MPISYTLSLCLSSCWFRLLLQDYVQYVSTLWYRSHERPLPRFPPLAFPNKSSRPRTMATKWPPLALIQGANAPTHGGHTSHPAAAPFA
jgi:hypothetical protein